MSFIKLNRQISKISQCTLNNLLTFL
jgi:hypothetical protein